MAGEHDRRRHPDRSRADSLFRALPRLKQELQLNVEIASPAHFIPELPGWRERSVLIERVGIVTFYHYDPYSQALAKIKQGTRQGPGRREQLLDRGLVEPRRLRELFEAIEPQLYRYPAVDPPSFRQRLDDVLRARAWAVRPRSSWPPST